MSVRVWREQERGLYAVCGSPDRRLIGEVAADDVDARRQPGGSPLRVTREHSHRSRTPLQRRDDVRTDVARRPHDQRRHGHTSVRAHRPLCVLVDPVPDLGRLLPRDLKSRRWKMCTSRISIRLPPGRGRR